MTPDLSEGEQAALAKLLREAIDADRYPFSPRIKMLKAVPAKPEPRAQPEPYPAAKPSERPSLALAKKRRR